MEVQDHSREPSSTALEKRALVRSALRWRVLAISAFVFGLCSALVFSLLLSGGGFQDFLAGGVGGDRHIARVRVEGFVEENDKFLALVERIRKSDKVAAVILSVDSPGGSGAGSEAIYESLRALAVEKPMVAVLHNVAASGGYMVALAADHIVARNMTLVGSVGVLFQWPRLGKAVQDYVYFDSIRSSSIKGHPDLFSDTPPEAREMMARLVEQSKHWFVALVQERRNMSGKELKKIADARVCSGRDAKDLKLIDAIGGENQALFWLRSERKVPGGLRVVEWEPDVEHEFGLLEYLFSSLGLPERLSSLFPVAFSQGKAGQNLGILALWEGRG